MNRFVPLRYDTFKRFAGQVKKAFDIRHCEALDTLSRASGFKDFHEVTVTCQPEQSNPKPTALQYSGDLGFDAWRAQMISVFGAEGMAEMEPKLRCWYRWTFEMAGEPAHSPPRPAEPGSVSSTSKAPDAGASLPETGCDSAAPPASTDSTAVVVTYRRRRHLTGKGHASTMA